MATGKNKCKACSEWFPPETMQKYPIGRVCGDKCRDALISKGYAKSRLAVEKQAKKATNKQHIKRKREFKANDIKLRKKTAQAAFNKYIRCRDEKEPCISCRRFHTGQYHAGHYKTTGAHSELRFNEDNCHKQCSSCNNHLSGNIEHYRPNLIEKIGRKAFDKLEGPHPVKKYSPADYKEIELKYKKKLKALLV